MIINHNMNGINAHRNMGMNTVSTGKSMEKLSSGLRINRAGDDAAGLSISEKMRGQIKGLTQAQRNAQDGISYIQTMEGALNEVSDMLTRAKELSTQYQNGTYNTEDKDAMSAELNTLNEEVKNIIDNTKFNGMTMGASVDIQIDDSTTKVTIDAGLTAVTIATKPTSADAVDSLIKNVNEQRSKYGSLQNRLEHTSNNLGTTVENLTASESRIRDTDMAKEMMEFNKKNIITQASQAMLAQANQLPQQVLSLLR
ncbi:MAG: flagellin [Cellulosilyticaceae bacterium]